MDRHYREIIKTEFGSQLICKSLVVELWEMATSMATSKRYDGSDCKVYVEVNIGFSGFCSMDEFERLLSG
jgi:hypothetical protein